MTDIRHIEKPFSTTADKLCCNMDTENRRKMLEPCKGRIYDTRCGSGRMFVQSEKLIEEHPDRLSDLSIYGHESSPAQPGTFPKITFDILGNLTLALPINEKLIEEFSAIAWSLFEGIRNNELEIQTLAEMRDGLLPQLICDTPKH